MNGWLILGELAVDLAKIIHDAMAQNLTHEDLVRELKATSEKMRIAVESMEKRLAEDDAEADAVLKGGKPDAA